MLRITGPDAVDIGSGRLGFADRNLGIAVEGTIVDAKWLNDVQEELSRAIEVTGVALDAGSQVQLAQAMRRLAGGNVRAVSASTALTADDAGLVSVTAAGGNRTLTLPAANAANGAPISLTILRTDTSANSVTIQRAGADTIEGATAFTIPVGGRLTLQSDGASIWYRVASGGALLNIQTFGASGTYTPTPGTNSILVELVGGGGGGGGAAAATVGNASAGGGGGAGGFARRRITGPITSQVVTVGAGGAGGVAVSGGNGGASSFGALLSAVGGGGGTGGAPASNSVTNVIGGSSGGNGAGGDINALGGPGWYAVIAPGGQLGGSGGASHYGAGGFQTSGASNGVAATTPGAGGSGGCIPASAGSANGGAGAAGLVMVWEFS